MPIIQDTIKKAIKLKGYQILEDKNRLCTVLEDLSPDLPGERKFIDKVYSDGVGKIFFQACMAEDSDKKMHLKEADTYLEEENGFNEKWRKRLLFYFESAVLGDSAGSRESSGQQPAGRVHKAAFRILSMGEEKRDEEFLVGHVVSGSTISKNLGPGPLFKLLYHKQSRQVGIKNMSESDWTIVGPGTVKKLCKPREVQPLEAGMMIRIKARIAQMNVFSVQ